MLPPDIIDVARRPTLVFRSTRVLGAGSEYQVDGDLTIGDITRPIDPAVDLGGIESIPGGPRHAGFEATTEIRRKDFASMRGTIRSYCCNTIATVTTSARARLRAPSSP